MDLLSHILQLSGVEKTALFHHSLYQQWAMKFPCQKSMGFHIVTQGQMYVRGLSLKEPLLMNKGDILLMSRGQDHEIATDLKVKPSQTMSLKSLPGPTNDKKPLATFASGVYGFKDVPTHPLFTEMPNRILIRAEQIPAHDPLHSALQLLSAELSTEQIGSESVAKNLLDILFHYILRKWIETSNDKKYMWNLAFKDAHLSKALKAIHETPEKDWGVDNLSDLSGLSRAAFAKKFKSLTGETPAYYLSKVRVQKAALCFQSDLMTVEQVAESVGYQDAFVFSKVFKRIQGLSPRDYRKQLRALEN